MIAQKGDTSEKKRRSESMKDFYKIFLISAGFISVLLGLICKYPKISSILIDFGFVIISINLSSQFLPLVFYLTEKSQKGGALLNYNTKIVKNKKRVVYHGLIFFIIKQRH